MLATLALAALIFAAELVIYIYVNRALKRRAAYRRRVGSLYTTQYVQSNPVFSSHNRPGEN